MILDGEEIVIANEQQTSEIIKLLKSARDSGNVKIGSNESTKALNRGKAHLVIIAADTEPIEIIAHLPILCMDKDVPYVFLPSKTAIGKALDLQRNVIAAAFYSETDVDMKRICASVKKVTSIVA